jgi:hypothetical protein
MVCARQLQDQDQGERHPVLRLRVHRPGHGRTDTAILTPSSFGTYKTPLAANKANTPTATLFGTAIALESLELDFGNKNEQISRIGSEQILHTDRKTVGTIMFEMTTVAVKDWLPR